MVITTSQLGRMKQLASQPTAAMHQAGRVLGGHSAKFETSGASSLPRSLDASVKSVKHTIGRRQTKHPAAQARKEHMQTLDRQRHARLAAEASRLEAERGFLETDEEMRLKVEEKSRPALKYARQRRQEDLDEIKDLNVRMNGARVLSESLPRARPPALLLDTPLPPCLPPLQKSKRSRLPANGPWHSKKRQRRRHGTTPSCSRTW